MATSFLGLAVGVVVITGALSYGCAARSTQLGTTQLTSARLAPTAPAVLVASSVDAIAPVMEREPEPEQATAVLVVHSDVATRCLGARGTTAVDRNASDVGWRAVLERVTTCMKTGSLRGQRLLVTGDEKERAAVRCVLSKMGIPEARVELRPSTASRIDIALTSRDDAASTASVTLPIERSSVIAFLSDDNLD